MNKNSENIIFYMHAGSGNHGCEAIVNSLCHMIPDSKDKVHLITYRADEDYKYSLKNLCMINEERKFSNHRLMHVFLYIYRLSSKDANSFMRFRYKEALKIPGSTAVSIGGDNYCYDDMLSDLALSNNVFNESGKRTVLLGCSIEPDLLNNERIVSDLKKYSMIIARETITYDALKACFGDNGPKLECIPDPAFTLGFNEKPLPDGFIEGNTVGINISPMAESKESVKGITMNAYIEMIEFVLKYSDMSIALIPHVVWENNDDRQVIKRLYEELAGRGYKDRVVVIDDNDAETLKGYIRRCRFFVGARTHATIAAYSSYVPTLVVGYSVKARGIAKDLFPNQKLENLVIPVQSISTGHELRTGIEWLIDNEEALKKELDTKIPECIKKAGKIVSLIGE